MEPSYCSSVSRKSSGCVWCLEKCGLALTWCRAVESGDEYPMLFMDEVSAWLLDTSAISAQRSISVLGLQVPGVPYYFEDCPRPQGGFDIHANLMPFFFTGRVPAGHADKAFEVSCSKTQRLPGADTVWALAKSVTPAATGGRLG